MKKYILSLLLMAPALILFAQKPVILSGTVKNMKKSEVLLFNKRTEMMRPSSSDTIKVTNGAFQFESQTADVTTATFSLVDLEQEKKDQALGELAMYTERGTRGFFQFFIYPGSVVTFTMDANDFSSPEMGGNVQINKDLVLYYRSMKEMRIEGQATRAQLLKCANDKMSDAFDQASKERLNHFEKLLKVQSQWMLSNYDNEYAMYLISNRSTTNETGSDLKAIYEKFSDRVKTSDSGKKLKAEIDRLLISDPGVKAPNFTLKDVRSGKEISLSDYKGSYVLLDFWGSWCSPCRRSHPELREKYSKYKSDQFEILGLAQDKTDEVIIEAATEDGITWPQVRLTEQRAGQYNVTELFGIKFYPTKILVDPNGVIIARNDEITNKLKEIFGK